MSGPIRRLDPTRYRRHLIHGEDRIWAETNCYVDVLVELLHGLGFEPIAALPFTLRIDFDGDQWTFFKFPHADLQTLFGIDIQELNPWRSLAHHVDEQVASGRPVLVELDSFYLPDTAGTAYHREHVKSTVAVNEIDIDERRLGYFHGRGYHALEGDDFADLFQLSGLVHERMLPPYIEYARLNVSKPLEGGALVEASLASLRAHIGLMPTTNPFERFRERLRVDLEWLATEPIETFHQYSFATIRQYGACCELAATYLEWLVGRGEDRLIEVHRCFQDISTSAKAFQFQLARAVARKRTLSLDPLEAMGDAWVEGRDRIGSVYG